MRSADCKWVWMVLHSGLHCLVSCIVDSSLITLNVVCVSSYLGSWPLAYWISWFSLGLSVCLSAYVCIDTHMRTLMDINCKIRNMFLK